MKKHTVESINEALNPINEGKLDDSQRKQLSKAVSKYNSGYVELMRAVNSIFGRSSMEALALSDGNDRISGAYRSYLKKKGSGKYE